MKTTLAPFRCTSQPRKPDSSKRKFINGIAKKTPEQHIEGKNSQLSPKPK
jgi:hypothetical protein